MGNCKDAFDLFSPSLLKTSAFSDAPVIPSKSQLKQDEEFTNIIKSQNT
jgi:hypothetical protein